MSDAVTIEAALGNPVRTRFLGDLSTPEPIPDAGIEAAVELMRDGRLFRYGEDRDTLPHAALLEQEFAAYLGRSFCVGINSGGCALFLALRAAGVGPGDKVLTNAFTLAPVPGAIAHAGAEPVLVDVTDRTVIDLDDLERKAAASGARVLLLSYMRGHQPDMDAVMALCDRLGLMVIEDCAHTMGAKWDGRLSGTYGHIACFSTQTFKHLNSGEGGLLVTDDEDIAARTILMSGSYMLYRQHKERPADAVFERHRLTTPNFSMRMSNLAAAVLRPQLAELDARAAGWRAIHDRLADRLAAIDNIRLPVRPEKEAFVPSSLQFLLEGLSDRQVEVFLGHADASGVHVKWFGRPEPSGFTSRHDHWRYFEAEQDVPAADRILHALCDIRLPLGLGDAECDTIAAVLQEAINTAVKTADQKT